MLQNETTQIELTWWDEDGCERTGRISLGCDASPETAAVLARLLRRADAAGAEAIGPAGVEFQWEWWVEAQEERS